MSSHWQWRQRRRLRLTLQVYWWRRRDDVNGRQKRVHNVRQIQEIGRSQHLRVVCLQRRFTRMFLPAIVCKINILTDTKRASAFSNNFVTPKRFQLGRFELTRITPFMVQHINDIVIDDPMHGLQRSVGRVPHIQIIVKRVRVLSRIAIQCLVLVYHVLVRCRCVKRRFMIFVSTNFEPNLHRWLRRVLVVHDRTHLDELHGATFTRGELGVRQRFVALIDMAYFVPVAVFVEREQQSVHLALEVVKQFIRGCILLMIIIISHQVLKHLLCVVVVLFVFVLVFIVVCVLCREVVVIVRAVLIHFVLLNFSI
mmetsp:Transcript_33690/g.54887  ORF Transcript_33690/g.54887 Transcript_33690/m.54887 type:complete len:311 (-) Transcript_33690:199-1131(-)